MSGFIYVDAIVVAFNGFENQSSSSERVALAVAGHGFMLNASVQLNRMLWGNNGKRVRELLPRTRDPLFAFALTAMDS